MPSSAVVPTNPTNPTVNPTVCFDVSKTLPYGPGQSISYSKDGYSSAYEEIPMKQYLEEVGTLPPKDWISNLEGSSNKCSFRIMANQAAIMAAVDPTAQAKRIAEAAAEIEQSVKSAGVAKEITAAAGPIMAKLETIEASMAKLETIEARLAAIEQQPAPACTIS